MMAVPSPTEGWIFWKIPYKERIFPSKKARQNLTFKKHGCGGTIRSRAKSSRLDWEGLHQLMKQDGQAGFTRH
ncbi:hypothetical protein STRDD11_01909 [Streptococcus sp. DD11]|nr:hypothetical protein STRDD11_01909 [Streptococcus sp. DD11]